MPKDKKSKKKNSEDDDFSEDVKKAADDFKDGAKKVKDKVEKEWDDLDVEETAVKGLKELEGLLSSFQKTIKKKRKEWEDEGMEDTMKKDAEKTKESVKEATIDVLDGVEKTAKELRKKLNNKK